MLRLTLRFARAAHEDEAGVALLVAMAFALMMAVMTLALTNLALSEVATVQGVDKSAQSFYVADGAVDRAIAVLRLDSDWGDGKGANANANNTTFKPLVDKWQAGGAGGNAVGQPFPATNSIGTYSIYIRRPTAAENPDPVNNIWVRAAGTVGGSTRSIEAFLHRMTPNDFTAYSGNTYTVSGGGGNVTIHGSAYFFSDLILKAVKTGVYNDRAIRPTDTAPYKNQLYVRGTLDMYTGNPTVGTASQPMYGVHASHINNPSKNIHTLEMDQVVPVIPYPNVTGYFNNLVSTGSYGNALSAGGSGSSSSSSGGIATGGTKGGSSSSSSSSSGGGGSSMQMILCTNSAGKGATQTTANLTFGSTYFFVPTQANAGCANGPTGSNYMLIWDPSQAVPLEFNTAQDSQVVLVPGTVTMSQNVTYSGIGTIAVQNSGGAAYAFDSSKAQVLSSQPASGTGDVLGCGYTQNSSMPSSDLLAMIVDGSAIMQGSGNKCNQEQDIALVVGANSSNSFTSTKNVQIFGMVLTDQLDTTQNPDFWQVPGLTNALPQALRLLMSFNVPLPVVIQEWHELIN